LATIKELKPYIFRCGSFSKIYGMTGWRVGYIQAAPELITVLTGINMDTVTCPPTIAQEAVIIGLTSKLDSLSEYIKQLIKNRKILIENLDKMGDWFSYIPPQGAYYCWVKYNSEKLAKKTGINKWTSYDLAMQLTKEAQVGLFPGTCFGIGGEGYLRITFGGDSEKLIQGLDRIKNWFENKLTP